MSLARFIEFLHFDFYYTSRYTCALLHARLQRNHKLNRTKCTWFLDSVADSFCLTFVISCDSFATRVTIILASKSKFVQRSQCDLIIVNEPFWDYRALFEWQNSRGNRRNRLTKWPFEFSNRSYRVQGCPLTYIRSLFKYHDIERRYGKFVPEFISRPNEQIWLSELTTKGFNPLTTVYIPAHSVSWTNFITTRWKILK